MFKFLISNLAYEVELWTLGDHTRMIKVGNIGKVDVLLKFLEKQQSIL